MKIRIGIDVGGTFTDAVAINDETLDILGFVKVLTTHNSKNGVADGIVLAISNIVSKYKIQPSNIVFIATGTTQATNAILEGDVYDVGIIVVTNKKKYSISNICLSNNKYINITTYTIKPDTNFDSNIEKIMLKIKQDNIKSIVASSPFSTDDPTFEKKILDIAKKYNIYSSATHDISQLYGIKIRTNTAVINACILPKMVATIDMIKTSIKDMGITSPILVMRCDGGVMPIDEVKKRPFLTILSGPAAGVYGALIHEKISSGIFLEVGGTSTDISIIKNGNIMLKHAQIGKHRLYLNSLDIRTIGVAGGSLIKLTYNKKIDVGPRSAHILGLKYSCFCNPCDLINSKLIFLESDGSKYACIKNPNGEIFAITLTCIINSIEAVKSNDYSFGNIESAKMAVSLLANFFNTNITNISNKILRIATLKCVSIINEFKKQYGIKQLMIFGGGGACSTLVPFIAKKLNAPYKICKNAPVISTIGVALSTIREVIEKTIFNVTPKDIENLKMQAIAKIKNSAEVIDTYVSFDKNILRVVATGTTKNLYTLSKLELIEIIARYLSCNKSLILLDKQLGNYFIFNATITKKIMNLTYKKKRLHIVIDSFGIIRLQKQIKKLYFYSNLVMLENLGDILKENSTYTDIGQIFPECTIVTPNKIIKLPNFCDTEKLLSFVKSEVDFSNVFDVAILIE